MIEIRRLLPSDAAAAAVLIRLFASDARDRGDGAPLPETSPAPSPAAWLAAPGNVMVGAWHDGEPVGMAYGYHLPRPDGRPAGLLLYSVDVAEDHRRRGIGTAVVNALRAEAAGSMWLVTNEENVAAMATYRAAGGRRPNPDDVMISFP